jgi:hypothetical protein
VGSLSVRFDDAGAPNSSRRLLPYDAPVDWRARIYRLLDHGKPPPPPDPEELVEVAVLSLPEASFLTAELQGRGLRARYFEWSGHLGRAPATGLNRGRVVVPRAELPAALEVFDEWRRL